MEIQVSSSPCASGPVMVPLCFRTFIRTLPLLDSWCIKTMVIYGFSFLSKEKDSKSENIKASMGCTVKLVFNNSDSWTTEVPINNGKDKQFFPWQLYREQMRSGTLGCVAMRGMSEGIHRLLSAFPHIDNCWSVEINLKLYASGEIEIDPLNSI